MNTTQKKGTFVPWLSAEDMHNNTLNWLSQLEFAKDEHLFFEDVVKTYIFQLLEPEISSENDALIKEINRSEKRVNLLVEAIKVHRSDLQIMLDSIKKHKEDEHYKKEHRNLTVLVSEFLKDYQTLKFKLFEVIQKILKKNKQHGLIDKL